ncbi:TonB-dependent receptor [Thalassotalea agarivorans]|uniref:TonB-dependent receptor n=1 Tax=Thalassotalea agarivorans TaxID=349064 RepID=A0A1I0FXT0_THASX|nr:TonB-dependent receptor [Thalassotalea agarivorans]SET63231.1 TonB-dependent receptor [Thalassotalea agarivorans]
MFSLNKVTLALVASGCLMCSTASFAQEEQTPPASSNEDSVVESRDSANDEVEVIEVTGFKSSLIKSLNQKRFADTVSEQISADDLGGLPDVSMADALTRLPGVAAVRTGGQAAEINIRGLGGGFVSSTLNGREQVSTSGSRSIEFDQYPSELISQAAVYKSTKASLIEGGVAGTVELTTASALNNDKQHTFNLNARGMYNDRASEVADAEEFGHRLSFSYQGKFFEDTLGVSVGYARLYQPSVATQFIGFAYNAQADVDMLPDDTNGPADAPNEEYISEGFELQHLGGVETRNGYVGALEWQPNDTFTVRADAFVSKFDSESFARGFRVKFDGETAAIANPTILGNSMIGGTINRKSTGNNTRVEIVNDDNQDFDSVESYGLNLDWQITDRLNANLDFTYSSAESDFRNGLLWALVAEDANADVPVLDPNVSISYLLNGSDLPDIGFSQADAFTDINRVMVSKYGIYPFENSDRLSAVRLDLEYELDNEFVSSVAFGMRYSDREYSNDRSVYQYGADNNFSSSEPPLKLTDDMVQVVDWEGEFSYFPSYLAIDLDKALNAWFGNDIPQPVQTWGANRDGEIDDSTSWSVLQSGEVYEEVASAYIMANLDMELFDLPITGNIGVRAVKTKQSSTAYENVGGLVEAGAQNIMDEVGLVNSNFKYTVEGIEYTDYLPSLNLNFHITDNSQIRFAAGKVMSRPDINRLASNRSIQISDEGEVTGNSNNNPFIRPFYANQYDLSYEQYFVETEGAFVFAVFHKDVESFLQDQTLFNYDFEAAGFYVPEKIVNETTGVETEVDPVGTYYTAFNNENGGHITGAEVALTQVFTFLPDLWSGLGIYVSYSYTQSNVAFETDLLGTTIDQPLEGLSENLATATLFYEYSDFETRLSFRYRDSFVSRQWGIDEQRLRFDDELIVDYQASYNVTDNLGLLFQVNNLTDEPTQSYFGTPEFSGTTQFFGRQFYFGATYSF